MKPNRHDFIKFSLGGILPASAAGACKELSKLLKTGHNQLE